MVEAIASSRCVLVCQSRTCKKQGAGSVLQVFQQLDLSDWTIVASPCMGQCGNGPMVRVLPDNIWYWRVQANEVKKIARTHLQQGHPVKTMLYPVMHA